MFTYLLTRPYEHGLCGWSVKIKPRRQSELRLSSRGLHTCSVDSSAWPMQELLRPSYSVSFCVCVFRAVLWSGLLSVSSVSFARLYGVGCCLYHSASVSFVRLYGVGCCLYHSVSFARLYGVGCCLYHSASVSFVRLYGVGCCLYHSVSFTRLHGVGCCLYYCVSVSFVRLHGVGCCLYHSVSVSFAQLHGVGCCLYHSVSVFRASSWSGLSVLFCVFRAAS